MSGWVGAGCDFSHAARVSASLVRYFYEIGLLAPLYIGRQTSDHYYTVAQLAPLNHIAVLKNLNFSC
jgi:DNA-binding transcriptional MerR regulator